MLKQVENQWHKVHCSFLLYGMGGDISFKTTAALEEQQYLYYEED